jgi:hypothetical protein
MSRIKFAKGKQKEFFDKILVSIGSPSIRELGNRLTGINYQTLKNYYSERRLLSDSLFEDLLELSGLKKNDSNFEELGERWGQIKGGKISKRK